MAARPAPMGGRSSSSRTPISAPAPSRGSSMGGLSSEIADDTTNVLLESATFDMYATRHTFQALKLPTDAAVRFGRGPDPALAWPAAERAVQLMLELCP